MISFLPLGRLILSLRIPLDTSTVISFVRCPNCLTCVSTIESLKTLLSEVHDPEYVSLVPFGVSHSEIEPLLMPSCVSIHLHVKLVLSWIQRFSLK